jgi:hypothetical protein
LTSPDVEMTADQAGARLRRLASAGTLMDSVRAGTGPPLDAEGKVMPSRKQLNRVNGENPDLFRIANSHEDRG